MLREHRKFDEFAGPRFFAHLAALEMHPLDTENRIEDLKNARGVGCCNLTTCCRQACPESMTTTENAHHPP